MCAPFIFIATNRLREGKLAAERDRAAPTPPQWNFT
jgi:hypothetical protein